VNILQRQTIDRLDQLIVSLKRTTAGEGSRGLDAGRAIVAASQGRLRTAAQAEHEAWGCVDGNPQRFCVPFDYLAQRAVLLVTNSGALTSSALGPVVLPLVGSGVVAAGANVVLGRSSNMLYPTISAKPTFSWLPSDSTQLANDSTLTLSQAAGVVKRGGINIRASRQLALQSEADLGSTLNRLLIQLSNDALDLAVLNGAGVSGEPQGLLQTTGVVSVSGANLNIAGLSAMEKSCVAADADDRRFSWFAGSDTRRILRTREISSGSGSIWPGGTLLGHPAYVSSKMPTAALLSGDFSNVDILLFGLGIELLVNPYADFQSGNVEFEVSLAMDVVTHFPASFSKSTSIT
jgi:HK97 family phage major capsid protein